MHCSRVVPLFPPIPHTLHTPQAPYSSVKHEFLSGKASDTEEEWPSKEENLLNYAQRRPKEERSYEGGSIHP